MSKLLLRQISKNLTLLYNDKCKTFKKKKKVLKCHLKTFNSFFKTHSLKKFKGQTA